MLLARNKKLLVALRMLYKRIPMTFQWLLPKIKPQMHSEIFNFNYYSMPNKLLCMSKKILVVQ